MVEAVMFIIRAFPKLFSAAVNQTVLVVALVSCGAARMPHDAKDAMMEAVVMLVARRLVNVALVAKAVLDTMASEDILAIVAFVALRVPVVAVFTASVDALTLDADTFEQRMLPVLMPVVRMLPSVVSASLLGSVTRMVPNVHELDDI
jgi:hypothetical protein